MLLLVQYRSSQNLVQQSQVRMQQQKWQRTPDNNSSKQQMAHSGGIRANCINRQQWRHLVSLGAATNGVTPIFFLEKLTTFLVITVCQFYSVTPIFSSKN